MSIRKSLTFRASSIGDCLMGKYLLENIYVESPQARLGIVVASRGAMIRDLFSAYPWLEVLEVNRRRPRAVFSLLKDFYGSDIVVTQYAGKKGGRFSLASKLVARLLAKRGGLVGFRDTSSWNSVLYDKLVPIRGDVAVVEHDREALRVAGIEVSVPFPKLQFVKDASVLQKFNLEAGTFVVVHLFAGNTKRGLSPDKKRELVQSLSKKLTDTRLVLSGGADDRAEALSVSEGISATVIAGKATLQELMNVIAESRAVVSVDTGVAHITAQLGIPLTVMTTCSHVGGNWWLPGQYGESAPITVFSRGDLCAPEHVYKEYPDCMNKIDMESIASKV